MMRPRRMKLAASSSVGATTSVFNLGIHEQTEGSKRDHRSVPTEW
jgi:hypothetical protein